MDWSSWKANAITQDYKTTNVITTEGVDFESLDNFTCFYTQNTENKNLQIFHKPEKRI